MFNFDLTPKIVKKIKNLRNRVGVIYSQNYQITHCNGYQHLFDLQKFKKIYQILKDERILKNGMVITPEKIDDSDILKIHTADYLRWIQDPLNLQDVLQTSHLTIFDTDIFDVFRYITGGTVLAGKLALLSNRSIFNLSGGYHHSLPDHGEGFCPINDIAISIQSLIDSNMVKKVLVIDLDYHQGNGVKHIFRDRKDIFTLSVHAAEWDIKPAISNMDILIESNITNDHYLTVISDILSGIECSFMPDIVFYLAGSDPFEYDALCDMKISEDTMLKRDIIVYKYVRDKDIPMVILPAGGYGEKSWKIYYNFIKWAILQG